MATPTMLYKHPGVHKIHGDSFDYVVVDADDLEALEEALSEGWAYTTTEAKEGSVDDSMPTRAELEQKADELDIGFNARTSDEKLLAKISKALESEV